VSSSGVASVLRFTLPATGDPREMGTRKLRRDSFEAAG
jgi:hypothetical protein